MLEVVARLIRARRRAVRFEQPFEGPPTLAGPVQEALPLANWESRLAEA